MSDMLTLPNDLPLARYRISLLPEARLALDGQAGTVLRGGFGFVLKEGTCLRPEGRLCGERCLHGADCSFAYLFEGVPPPDADVLRTHQAIPKPFVLEPPDADRQTLGPGERLTFQLVLVGQAIWHFPYLLAAFRALGMRGIGKDRVRARLCDAVALLPGQNEITLFDGRLGRLLGNQPEPATAQAWGQPQDARAGEELDRIHFAWLTPGRLKHQGRFLHTTPPFHVVVRSLLRRVSSLSYFYGAGRWEIDYRGWIERAKGVEVAESDARWQEWGRYSTRQKQHMKLGGIVGQVTYTGDVAPFLPLLRLGELVHVGKGAVFGNGRYEMRNEE